MLLWTLDPLRAFFFACLDGDTVQGIVETEKKLECRPTQEFERNILIRRRNIDPPGDQLTCCLRTLVSFLACSAFLDKKILVVVGANAFSWGDILGG